MDEKACAETIDKRMSVLSYAPAEYNRIVSSMWPAMRTFGSWHLCYGNCGLGRDALVIAEERRIKNAEQSTNYGRERLYYQVGVATK